VLLNSVQTDFCQGLMDRLRGSVDLLIFNPPYVVTPSEEIRSTDPLAWSWAGGKDGREVLDRFFDHSIANVSALRFHG
jgi:release factor glutamine methyltransferase